MKPSVLIAAGCSWVAGRAIDTDPASTEFNIDHSEDPMFVEQHSFAGQLQRRLGLDEIQFVARNGANNDEQIDSLVDYIDNNYSRYSQIFVLWGLTSIYRWEMYSDITEQVHSCQYGRKFKSVKLNEQVKYHFTHHWDKDYELKKLGTKVLLLNGYLKNLGIEHLFFNAFQSYNVEDLKIKNISSREFYHVDETDNDLLSFLCSTDSVKLSQSKFPWLNLWKPAEWQHNNEAIRQLQKSGLLDVATAHPTVRAHELIANELYDYIKEKNNERI